MIAELQTVIRPAGRLTEEELAYVVETARVDGHGSLGVTHIIERDKDLIGHLSMCGIPLVLVWLHTKKAKIRDSLRILDFCENTIRNSGATGMLVPCSKSSPFFTSMEGLGFSKGDEMTMFWKSL